MRTVLYILLALVGTVVLYVAIALARGTYVDWRPTGIVPAVALGEPAARDTLRDSTFTFLTWNVGYGGLGAGADFFLDAGGFYFSHGRMVHSSEDDVELYMRGITQQLEATQVDFALLQEVDSSSARSYHRPELFELADTKPGFSAVFTPNYINERVPIPVFEPWQVYGDVYSGLLNLTRYAPLSSERHQLPGEFGWPDRVFQLDRCLLVQRFPLANGKTLTVINLHLSAYDDGQLKAAQLGYLAELLRGEQAAGRLVVVGGDWNLVPPTFPYDRFMADPDRRYVQGSLQESFPEPGWQWIYDARTPSNRKIDSPYLRDSSFVTIIDMFLISPGLRAVESKGIRQDFQFSDHQPVYVELALEE